MAKSSGHTPCDVRSGSSGRRPRNLPSPRGHPPGEWVYPDHRVAAQRANGSSGGRLVRRDGPEYGGLTACLTQWLVADGQSPIEASSSPRNRYVGPSRLGRLELLGERCTAERRAAARLLPPNGSASSQALSEALVVVRTILVAPTRRIDVARPTEGQDSVRPGVAYPQVALQSIEPNGIHICIPGKDMLHPNRAVLTPYEAIDDLGGKSILGSGGAFSSPNPFSTSNV